MSQARKSTSILKQAKDRELEAYAQTYFYYTKLFQDQVHAMQHNPQEMNAAHTQVTAENTAKQRTLPFTRPTPEITQQTLYDLAKACEAEPKNFIELSSKVSRYIRKDTHRNDYNSRTRIAFYATYYVQLLVMEVLGHPDRHYMDVRVVIGRANQLL